MNEGTSGGFKEVILKLLVKMYMERRGSGGCIECLKQRLKYAHTSATSNGFARSREV
jgi:hypothetical protein